MKTITVSIDRVGRPVLNAEGFAGGGCLEKAAPIISALSDPNRADGVLTVEKPELYQTEANEERIGWE